MSASLRHVELSCRAGMFGVLVVASGCIGLRTPLDDAARSENVSDVGVCGISTSRRTVHPVPDVLILLDRSNSMNWSLTADSACRVGASGCTTRLAAVTSAVKTLVTSNATIHWGLELFSTPNASVCTVSESPQVPVAANSVSAIEAALSSLTTETSTPTTAALNVATAYLKKLNDGNSKAILLATDGAPTCAGLSATSDDLPAAESAAAAAKTAGFPVYVIGIGPEVANLDGLALAGGTHAYYPVTSTSALDEALSAIAKVVSLCTFKTDKPPSNEDLVYVYVDQQQVAQDPDNGWTFDRSDSTRSTIILTGDYCRRLLAAGTTSTVEIAQYDCTDLVPTVDGA